MLPSLNTAMIRVAKIVVIPLRQAVILAVLFCENFFGQF